MLGKCKALYRLACHALYAVDANEVCRVHNKTEMCAMH